MKKEEKEKKAEKPEKEEKKPEKKAEEKTSHKAEKEEKSKHEKEEEKKSENKREKKEEPKKVKEEKAEKKQEESGHKSEKKYEKREAGEKAHKEQKHEKREEHAEKKEDHRDPEHGEGKKRPRKQKPKRGKPSKKSFVELKPAEITEAVVHLANEGHSQSEIGLILRDQYGIPKVSKAIGKKLGAILEDNKLLGQVPEDLMNLIRKSVMLREHLEKNKKDMSAKRGLMLTVSKIRALEKYYKRNGKLPISWRYSPETAALLAK